MNKKLGLFIMLIFSFVVYGVEKLELNKVEFYGTFISQEYLDKKGNLVGPGGIIKKLPVKIDYWPADNVVDAPPEIIIIKGEFFNNSKNLISTENINISVRFKISKIIYDEKDEMDIEKSEENQYWDKPILTNSINIKNLKSNSKIKKELLRFNMYDLVSSYDSKGLNPWLCEVTVTDNKGLKYIKTFEIGIVW